MLIKYKPIWMFIVLLVLPIYSSVSLASDDIKMARRLSPNKLQDQYINALFFAAMEASYDEYGPYSITSDAPAVMRGRAVSALTKRKAINTYVSPVNETLLGKVLVVPIPVRRGILSYRVALVHKENLGSVAKTKGVDELRNVRVGMYRGSSTLRVLKKQHFNTIESENHLSMFSMLEHKRFTYVLRGIHEVYDELETKKEMMPNIVVEPGIAFHLFMPTVIFLSPTETRLAERLEKGLLKILETGEFKQIFDKYYLPFAKQADLQDRKIIKIYNPLSDMIDFPEKPGLWFDPEEAKSL